MFGQPWMAVASLVGLVCLAAVAAHLAWAVWAGRRAANVPAGAWIAAVLLAAAALSSQGPSSELALAVGVAIGAGVLNPKFACKHGVRPHPRPLPLRQERETVASPTAVREAGAARSSGQAG